MVNVDNRNSQWVDMDIGKWTIPMVQQPTQSVSKWAMLWMQDEPTPVEFPRTFLTIRLITIVDYSRWEIAFWTNAEFTVDSRWWGQCLLAVVGSDIMILQVEDA